ncbi:response regulator [Acidaminobacter sp. JC074]|nr:response regulator [Acidaminobacter sp. JC074]MCH4888165.1 response regulator [Acidaminobacter sp. JC074]
MCYNEFSTSNKGVRKIIKILICDDSITIRKKLQGAISIDKEIEYYEAKNGVEAIKMYKDVSPNIVFMDIIMPEQDGIEALKQIMTYDPKAVVIMLSSVGTKMNLKVALESGASDFIQKPWDIKNLNTVLSKYI